MKTYLPFLLIMVLMMFMDFGVIRNELRTLFHEVDRAGSAHAAFKDQVAFSSIKACTQLGGICLVAPENQPDCPETENCTRDPEEV